MPSTSARPVAAAALNSHFDTRTAAYELSGRLRETLTAAGPAICDLLRLFGSFHHRAAFEDAAEIVRYELNPDILLGCTAESVLGGGTELEGRAGLSALALRLPGADLRPFRLGAHELLTSVDMPDLFRGYLGVNEERRHVITIADPFTTPTAKLLTLLAPDGERPGCAAIGGLASGASQPGHNVLMLDRAAYMDGMIGVSIGGVRIDALVSQGCRPIGPPMVITRCSGNTILELGGRSAIEVAQEIVSGLDEARRALLGRGLFVGLVVNEYRERFGRGDFVIRAILGANSRNGGITVSESPRVGQTMQFHLRDPATAEEDLQLLLDAEQLDDRPFAALLFNCTGRGTRLFGTPSNDSALLQRRVGPVPLAGFRAAGEIGPIGDRTFVHGHTACAALFRSV